MRKAKEIFLEQAAIKEAKHPKTAPKIICFSLAMAFFVLSLFLLGAVHAPIYGAVGSNITRSWVRLVLMILALIAIQASVGLSAVGVTSSKYLFHCISSVTLSLSVAMDVGLALYYFIWVI